MRKVLPFAPFAVTTHHYFYFYKIAFSFTLFDKNHSCTIFCPQYCDVESEDVKMETSPNNNDITNTVNSAALKRTTCKSERVTQSCKADKDKAKPNRIDHILKPDYWLSSDELFETLRLIETQFPSI